MGDAIKKENLNRDYFWFLGLLYHFINIADVPLNTDAQVAISIKQVEKD